VISWFSRKRAFALGITAAGSGLGGVILPIMVNKLIPKVGFGWAMRIVAFLQLGLLIFANLTVRSRMPPRPNPLKATQFLKPMMEKRFILLMLASFVFFLGLFLPINYIQVQGIQYGMSPSLANYLIPILNTGRFACPSTFVCSEANQRQHIRANHSTLHCRQTRPLQH
jgi:MFS family permease